MKILFLDLDGTVRKTKSGATFINDPYDQELIPGVQDAIARHHNWLIIGITNQGGVGAGYKSLESCILEQQQTLKLISAMSCIYFCPDDGQKCFLVCDNNSPISYLEIARPDLKGSFRKPNPGMIKLALERQKSDKSIIQYMMVGDRTEDQECAANANIPFLWAKDWRRR